MIKSENVSIVSMNTGEVLAVYEGGVRIQTEEEIENSKKYFEKKNGRNTGSRMNEVYEKHGAFIWNIHSTAKQLFPEIKPSSLTKLMFLSTYLGYDGYLIDIAKEPILKKHLMHYLKISDRTSETFLKEMQNSELIREDNGKLYLNDKMFARGKIPKDRIKDLAEDEQYITRIYIDGVRTLYNSATVTSHKTLSYIFRILPYVNREFNICCFNPLEKDLDKINAMSLGDFADIVGYDKSHISRLAATLCEPTFETKGRIRNAMRYVTRDGLNKEKYTMFINPCVYYAGSQWKRVEILGKF